MCMVDYGDDLATIYRAVTRRTRKERRCEECGRKITVGEKYENAFMVYDGQSSTFVTCEHCLVAMKWLVKNCGGFMHSGVWEDLEEHIQEYPTLAFPLSKLAVGRRRHWRRFSGDGLMPVPPVPRSLEEAGLEH